MIADQAKEPHEYLTSYQWLKIAERTFPLKNEDMFALGKFIVARWFGEPVVGIHECTDVLMALGFLVNWLKNEDGDILICELERWHRDGGNNLPLDQFIIEFTGHDDVDIAIYKMVVHGTVDDG